MLSGKKRRHDLEDPAVRSRRADEEAEDLNGGDEDEGDEEEEDEDAHGAAHAHGAQVSAASGSRAGAGMGVPTPGSSKRGKRPGGAGRGREDEAEAEDGAGGMDEGPGGQREDGAGGLDIDLAKLPTMSPQEMQDLLDKFTPEQMSRYEAYRRSALNKAMVKKMLSSVAGTNVSQNVIIVLAGIAKLFVGEMVEAARVVMSERGDEGPVRPAHLREAHRRLRASNRMPSRTRTPILR